MIDISSSSFCTTALIKNKECYVPQRNFADACKRMQLVLHLLYPTRACLKYVTFRRGRRVHLSRHHTPVNVDGEFNCHDITRLLTWTKSSIVTLSHTCESICTPGTRHFHYEPTFCRKYFYPFLCRYFTKRQFTENFLQ